MAIDVLRLADGRYEAHDRLGSGNFGEVYLGVDRYLDQVVAIKLFKEHVDFDAVVLEAQIQGRLTHPNVVGLRDVVLQPPRPFTVMDLCPAGSVNARMGAQEVSMTQAIGWTKDALAGLGAAHRQNIVHRDVKPGNWLLLQNGHAAISDFGIAEDTFRQLRVADAIYLPHMAPELLAGDSSPASDVWAVGCSLYRLLTGEYPFEDMDEALAGRYEAPHRLNRQVPMSLTRVIEKSLALDPQDRYTTAVEMFGALNACSVSCAWTKVDDPDAVEAWEVSTAIANYRVALVQRPRAGLILRATKDLGRGVGARQVRSEPVPSVPRGLQIMRRWLIEVVEGHTL
jgi:eukaryotic-like serine/threonine-protein kinase